MGTEKYELLFRRQDELNMLRRLVAQKRSQFIYVRGRRRVGKSWLLTHFAQSQKKEILYFSGAKDASARISMQEFVLAWSRFSGDPHLTTLRPELISWRTIWITICDFLKKHNRRVCFIFDEIQWIAKVGSGFIGSLKEAWIELEKGNLAHIVICGSSNRFFANHVGGEEKILRGLQTHASLIVQPLTPQEMQKALLPNWKLEELLMLYMLIGGIPYYLQQIDPRLGFVKAISKTLFSAGTIFLQEANEVLGLEFNRMSIENVKKILSVLAVHGGSQREVRKKFKLSSSTVSELFTKLQEFQIISPVRNYSKRRQLKINGVETFYIIDDFYLNTFFSLLAPLASEIEHNHEGKKALFAHRILDSEGYYIEGFSGKIFEDLVRYLLKRAPLESKLLQKLAVTDHNFTLYQEHDKNIQIDIILEQKTDRAVYVCECKWAKNLDVAWIDQVVHKASYLDTEYHRVPVLFIGQKGVTTAFHNKAEAAGVIVIEGGDLLF
jgi:predicted AAA+ superfamily ATPase